MKTKILSILILGLLITAVQTKTEIGHVKNRDCALMVGGTCIISLLLGGWIMNYKSLGKKDKKEKSLSNNENIVLYKRNGNYFIKDKDGERNLKYYLSDEEQSIDNVLNLQVDFINDQQPPEINEEQELQELRDFKKKAQGFSVQLREGTYNLKSNNPSVKLYQICNACDKTNINPNTNDFTVNLAAVINNNKNS